jgi:hypothetical protein
MPMVSATVEQFDTFSCCSQLVCSNSIALTHTRSLARSLTHQIPTAQCMTDWMGRIFGNAVKP